MLKLRFVPTVHKQGTRRRSRQNCIALGPDPRHGHKVKTPSNSQRRLACSACVRVGMNRRVPRSEVERITGHGLTREEEKSLWLHYALLTPLLTEPDAAMSKARENLRRWSGMHRRDGMTIRISKSGETCSTAVSTRSSTF